MLKTTRLLKREVIQVPLRCAVSVGGGYLLGLGTICTTASPLAAALAGILSPLYAFCILGGTLLAYVFRQAPEHMLYLLTALVCVLAVRILFCEATRPHMQAILTTVACVPAGLLTELCFQAGEGYFPFYVMQSFLIGIAAYFLADARDTLRQQKKLRFQTARSFTYAICGLLGVTALCGIDLVFCNPGRVLGMIMTLFGAKQFRQSGGTICGAIAACGAVLCSVELGMPLLFLPITGLLAGFLCRLPHAVWIPAFFAMELLGSAVLDSSPALAKSIVELILACGLYALCCRIDLRRWIAQELPAADLAVVHQEQFLAASLASLREETAAVMQRLKPPAPADALQEVREQLCSGCKNEGYCWKQRRTQTEEGFCQLLHHPQLNPKPEALDGCIRREQITVCCLRIGGRAALRRSDAVHLAQSRSVMLAHMHLLEEMAEASARRRSLQLCASETASLKQRLRTCNLEWQGCFVHQLRHGRYAAELYTKREYATAMLEDMLSDLLDVPMCAIPVQQQGERRRYCLYEQPAYTLQVHLHRQTASGCTRCGDTAAVFTDPTGSQYLVLSDGMGSGSAASLASTLSVRTLTQLVTSGMDVETAIRLINTMLLCETSTEHFATVDVLRIHPDSGELTLYKSGAAATILQRGSRVLKVTSPSFPIGILANSEIFTKTVPAASGDRIVMLSDGIHEAAYPFIRELLLQQLPMEQVLAEIRRQAAAFHAGERMDDVTIMTATVCGKHTPLAENVATKREMPARATKNIVKVAQT